MFVFGSFRFDVANASLKRGKQAIVLTPKALNVLHYLVEHAGQLVTKDDLWRAVWPRISVTDATLTMCVSELRKALRDPSKTPRYIETVHRLGYRFIAPVSTEPDRFSNSAVARQELECAPGLLCPSPHFVGRQPELAELHKWLELASKGERQIVFVTGEPGIGKTTLVEEFMRQEQVGRNGVWLGRGQCIEHYGTGEAYLPLLDALGRLCREPGGGRLVELLDRYAPAWLVQMPALIGKAERRELEGKAAGVTRTLMLRQLTEAMEVISRERLSGAPPGHGASARPWHLSVGRSDRARASTEKSQARIAGPWSMPRDAFGAAERSSGNGVSQPAIPFYFSLNFVQRTAFRRNPGFTIFARFSPYNLRADRRQSALHGQCGGLPP
jgi:DNA-binding winged helix-turn-helix (wHTH) protein